MLTSMVSMKNTLLPILLLALLAGAPSAPRADVVYLTSGGKLEGRIVEQTESSIEVDIGAGSLTFPMSSVERIEEGRSQLDDYDERVQGLADNDRDGWLELAQWASSVGLGTQSLRAYEHVLTLDPRNPEANRALGRVEVDGRWMTEDEAYRARGYVMFEGQWMTPAEQESILRAREADQAARRSLEVGFPGSQEVPAAQPGPALRDIDVAHGYRRFRYRTGVSRPMSENRVNSGRNVMSMRPVAPWPGCR